MKFSIVIPTYNGAFFIEETLRSALAQSRPANEIIISDDNSSDETLAICKKYSAQIKIFTNSDGPSGFVNGWNRAIKLANYDYISILHQDDILAPTFFEEAERSMLTFPEIKHFFVACSYIDANSTSLCNLDYCDGSLCYYSGNEYFKAYQNVGSPHIHRCPGVITHRDIFNKCSYRVEAGHIADDDFFYRVGQYTNVLGLLKPLASYRIHSKSETGALNNIEIAIRLAKDYQFQMETWKDNEHIEKEEFNYFVKWARHYAFLKFYNGIKSNNDALTMSGRQDLMRIKREGHKLSTKELFLLYISSAIGYTATKKLLNICKK